MKNSKLLWTVGIGLVISALVWLFGDFKEREGMSREEALEKARKAKAEKAKAVTTEEEENEA